jgi:hypothetical protein
MLAWLSDMAVTYPLILLPVHDPGLGQLLYAFTTRRWVARRQWSSRALPARRQLPALLLLLPLLLLQQLLPSLQVLHLPLHCSRLLLLLLLPLLLVALLPLLLLVLLPILQMIRSIVLLLLLPGLLVIPWAQAVGCGCKQQQMTRSLGSNNNVAMAWLLQDD